MERVNRILNVIYAVFWSIMEGLAVFVIDIVIPAAILFAALLFVLFVFFALLAKVIL